eukprot:1924879-Rhodomonas_salina.3
MRIQPRTLYHNQNWSKTNANANANAKKNSSCTAQSTSNRGSGALKFCVLVVDFSVVSTCVRHGRDSEGGSKRVREPLR